MSENIYTCKNCQENFIPKDKTYSIFCSKSCSAKFNNKGRKRTKESKEKTKQSVIEYHKKIGTYDKEKIKIKKKKRKLVKKILIADYSLSRKNHLSPRNKENIEGPYTKLFFNKCSHCDKLFYNKRNIKYCEEHSILYGRNNRNKYAFTFNPFDYPDLFNLELLKEKGWYCKGGRYKKWNPYGLTRDHKISVNEAIKNNYDPYYIKHPLNCELMSFEKNNKKKIKSSLTYQQLLKIVDKYEN